MSAGDRHRGDADGPWPEPSTRPRPRAQPGCQNRQRPAKRMHTYGAVTYLASAVALIGAVPGRVPLWPATLTQVASSFVNRVSPANIGGMALNARFLRKNGVSPSAVVAGGGVNALMGRRRSPDPTGHLLRPGRPPAGAGLQAAAGQQAAADPRPGSRTRRPRAGHPPGQAIR